MKANKKPTMFFDADGGAAGGGEGGNNNPGAEAQNEGIFGGGSAEGGGNATGGEGEGSAGQQGTPAQGTPSPAQGQPAPTQLTPEAISQLIREAAQAGAQAGQQKPTEQPQMTEEQIDQMTNRFKASPELVADLLEGGDKSLAAMSAIVEGVVKHATTVAYLQTQLAQKQLLEQMNPVMSHFQEAQREKLRNEFFEAHQDLKGHDKLLAAVKASLDQEGLLEGKSKKDAFAIIAGRAKEVLSATGAGGAPAAGQPKPSGMASLSRGGQHGAAASSGAGGSTPKTAEAIFG